MNHSTPFKITTSPRAKYTGNVRESSSARIHGNEDQDQDKMGLVNREIVNVIVQCKNEKSKLGPKYVRELEGTLLRESKDTIGILASSQHGFSAGANLQFMSSSLPMIFYTENEVNSNEHMYINHAMSRLFPNLTISYNPNTNTVSNFYLQDPM